METNEMKRENLKETIAFMKKEWAKMPCVMRREALAKDINYLSKKLLGLTFTTEGK